MSKHANFSDGAIKAMSDVILSKKPKSIVATVEKINKALSTNQTSTRVRNEDTIELSFYVTDTEGNGIASIKSPPIREGESVTIADVEGLFRFELK